MDVARYSDHTLSEIEHPTRGYEEAVIHVPITESNGIVSIDAPVPNTVEVLAFLPPTDGLSPLVLDQQLMTATEPNDYGV